MNTISLILCNIRSVHNVGSIFRTADCAGVSKIYLCGYTPAPIDRFGRKRADFAKVSLGAEENLKWESVFDSAALIKKLKSKGMQIVAVEQASNSIDYKDVELKSPAAIVYGNEVTGVPKEILELSDVIAEIPMRGSKESLNVSVSVGVSLFRFIDN
jgi:23S rRNA (guanosine2251-2'-O)-methyltransferase